MAVIVPLELGDQHADAGRMAVKQVTGHMHAKIGVRARSMTVPDVR